MTTRCSRVTVSALPSNQHHPQWHTDLTSTLDFSLGCVFGSQMCWQLCRQGPWGQTGGWGLQQEAPKLCLTEDTPHSCLLWRLHQHWLPNASLQWEVTHLLFVSQGNEACNKHCVSSGWSLLGQNWMGVQLLASGMRRHCSRAVST